VLARGLIMETNATSTFCRNPRAERINPGSGFSIGTQRDNQDPQRTLRLYQLLYHYFHEDAAGASQRTLSVANESMPQPASELLQMVEYGKNG